jgi:DNA ligase-associated metallophosphoesterase
MSESLEIEIAGEAIRLLADRAMFWIRERALLIADLHLGKADTFRSAGIALPSGGTRHDLRRLTALLSTTQATRLIVLGDMIHSTANERRWRESWDEWRAAHEFLRIDVVAGNHDRALESLGLDIHRHATQLTMSPFALRHAPKPGHDAHVVCGHLHPVVRMPGVAKRWPSFVLQDDQTILPAFSEFTGGSEIDRVGKRLALCNGESIVRVFQPNDDGR